MSVSHGADVEALRASSRELADVAQALFTANVAVTARVYDFRWNGPDATRFRAAWESEYSPQLGSVCTALNKAAAEIAEQAADQEQASSATGAAPSPATDDLRERLKAQRNMLMLMVDTAKVGQALAAHPEAMTSLAKFNEAWRLSGAFSSNLAKYGGRALGFAGVVINAKGVADGWSEGDWAKTFQNFVPLGATGLAATGVIAGGTAAAVTVPFGIGTAIGNEINDQMEGTRYGDRVTENFEAVFDAYGAAGMLLTPIVLAKSGLDMLVDDGEAPPIP